MGHIYNDHKATLDEATYCDKTSCHKRRLILANMQIKQVELSSLFDGAEKFGRLHHVCARKGA